MEDQKSYKFGKPWSLVWTLLEMYVFMSFLCLVQLFFSILSSSGYIFHVILNIIITIKVKSNSG